MWKLKRVLSFSQILNIKNDLWKYNFTMLQTLQFYVNLLYYAELCRIFFIYEFFNEREISN